LPPLSAMGRAAAGAGTTSAARPPLNQSAPSSARRPASS
jgi:hypothetical protein